MESEVKKKLILNKDWCKGCKICIAFCSANVLGLKDGKVEIIDMDSCTNCKLCELRCPDLAIHLGGNDHGK